MISIRPWLARAAVFTLALQSFACLLGEMYGLWPMKGFALCVVIPATLALIVLAWLAHRAPGRPGPACTWIVEGTLGGILAAVAYDLYRLPFVLSGFPLFKVFPRFGQLLLGADGPEWLVNALGWLYHFSNGAALGIMFLCLLPRITRGRAFWGAIAWALTVEAILLITPYAAFFALKKNASFLALTLSAHLVFGAALGLWCGRRRLVSAPENL